MARRRNARARRRSEQLTEASILRLLPRFWPRRNRGAIPNCSELLNELRYLEVTTLGQLVAILKKQRRTVVTEDQRPFTTIERRIYLEDNGGAFVSDCTRRRRFFTLEGLTRTALELEFGERYEDFLRSNYRMERPREP